MEAINQSQKGNLSFEALKMRFEKGIQPQDINPIIWWQRMLAMQRKLKSSNEAYDDNIEIMSYIAIYLPKYSQFQI